MKIDGTPFRSIWVDETDHWSVRIIDQTKLPWAIDIVRLTTMESVAHAIKAIDRLPTDGACYSISPYPGVRLGKRTRKYSDDHHLGNAGSRRCQPRGPPSI